MKPVKPVLTAIVACGILGVTALAQTSAPPAGVVIEAEDFKPKGAGWKVVMNGQGNYMVDIIGFNHISGERVLSGDAKAKDAKAIATVQIPEAGDYRVWSRCEAPTGTEERFRVEIRQAGKLVGSAVMGEKDAPKYWFGSDKPVGQFDISYGSEGLVEQSFDVKGLQAGPAEITLMAIEQPELAANRNVDFIFLTRDPSESLHAPGRHDLYPILDAALPHIPTRYFVRLTSPDAGSYDLTYQYNRGPWYVGETNLTLEANKPSAWIPLKKQDVCHFTGLEVRRAQPSLDVRIEFAGSSSGTPIFRSLEWKDPRSGSVSISLPPYPNKYKGESIQTAEEQYRDILAWLKAHPSKVGREPRISLGVGGWMPIWQRGRIADAAADVWFELGMRGFPGGSAEQLAIGRERFKQRGLEIGRTIVLGEYRCMPTPENIALKKKQAEDLGVLPLVHRFDYGDEIAFSEWLALLKPEELKTKFAEWQQKKHGKMNFDTPDSSAAAAKSNPQLYVDSREFYEEAAIAKVAELAQEIPKQLGADVLHGGNVHMHPWYYPEIAKDVKWFRGKAASFGRHSEYFWQVGQPGPLINGYVADHYRSGMRDNPKAVHFQYTMPHSPGNSDASFRRTAFTHLAHGARGLDYFAIGINSSWTENYVDFRDPERYAAMRDINRAMATIEDILPESRVVPSEVAMILSDSTERWDFAGIATDKAGLSVFGANYKETRLCYHMDRVGMYYALVHGSRSPDLLLEEDVAHGDLKNYKVAYWVGDCVHPKALKALEEWVKNGGQLFATAGAFHFDQYRKPFADGLAFLGLKSAQLDEKVIFFRPQIELPRLAPLDQLGDMPVFAVVDRVEASPDAKVVAKFKSGSPAVIERTLGKGKITYVAALPGPTYLWSAYQPPPVPSRGPSSHVTLTNFNADARAWILGPAKAATSSVEAEGGLIDARLLKSPKGHAVALANYSVDVNKPVTLTIRGVEGIRKITSANRGELKLQREKDGSVRLTYPPGLGDILRIETKP